MRFIAVLLLFFCVIVVSSSVRAQTCFNPREAEAEQGIRIHSELMVIGLNCAHKTTDDGKSLYVLYREFTEEHGDLFADYERILMEYYARNDDETPEATINTLRTSFANKISTDSAKMRPDVFCARYAPRISEVSKMTHETFRKWAATIYPAHPVSHPVCEEGAES